MTINGSTYHELSFLFFIGMSIISLFHCMSIISHFLLGLTHKNGHIIEHQSIFLIALFCDFVCVCACVWGWEGCSYD